MKWQIDIFLLEGGNCIRRSYPTSVFSLLSWTQKKSRREDLMQWEETLNFSLGNSFFYSYAECHCLISLSVFIKWSRTIVVEREKNLCLKSNLFGSKAFSLKSIFFLFFLSFSQWIQKIFISLIQKSKWEFENIFSTGFNMYAKI